MINPATGQRVTEFGPMASAEVILLDEINRIPLKSQSAFLEALQDRTITVGKDTYDLPAFSFAIATMNPVELGQGRSEEHTSELQSLMRISYAVFCLKKKKKRTNTIKQSKHNQNHSQQHNSKVIHT